MYDKGLNKVEACGKYILKLTKLLWKGTKGHFFVTENTSPLRISSSKFSSSPNHNASEFSIYPTDCHFYVQIFIIKRSAPRFDCE